MENIDQNNTKLWLQFKDGNKDAFGELYHAHIKSLIAYGSKLCPDQELLKDTIQDLFIELWNARENLADVGSVQFYLFKALRYKLIRAEKMRQARSAVSQNVFFGAAAETNLDAPVESVIMDKETLDSQINTLRKAVATLTKRQQEAIQLRFYQGFSNDQIAELMEMNYQSVSNLLYSALCRIKKNLKAPVFTTALVAALHLFF
jgi:RNA polymerase sigma factor (sigma-70 family)